MANKLDDLFSNWKNGDIKVTRKVPICLLLDVSSSMSDKDGSQKTKIEEMNDNLVTFLDYVRNDARASKICDLCIITFGQKIDVVTNYDSIDNIKNPTFTAHGGTPLGGAIDKAVELLESRRQYYRDNDIEHFKPIVLLMSDGEPTDNYKASAKSFSDRVNKKELKIFPVGMGKQFNCSVLEEFSPILKPKQISTTEEFAKLFELLSSSSSRPEEDPLEKWWNEEA